MSQLPAHIVWIIIALFCAGLWSLALGMLLGVQS